MKVSAKIAVDDRGDACQDFKDRFDYRTSLMAGIFAEVDRTGDTDGSATTAAPMTMSIVPATSGSIP